MVRALTRRYSIQSSGSFSVRRMPPDNDQQQNVTPDSNDEEDKDSDDNQETKSVDTKIAEDQSTEHQNIPPEKPQSGKFLCLYQSLNLHIKVAQPKLN